MADTNQATIKEKSNNDNEKMKIETLPDRPKSKTKTQFVNVAIFKN